ncbi:folate-binding protein [Lysobacter sp.]|uniref:CAF17-like 4Fe-4S cluster assembly/insertion protein YgfZ n=1 Tax=Lysobacter sp. TaxID=72226 RepID=UPI002D5559F0|nr:folate-binding protein [Lysobacter sp.]HZX77823.1 folate-binding protein [Lysobacter sp.]
MHDNPQALASNTFALPGHRLITLEGRDAIAFAQAQFMNDLALLESRQWQWSGWLTPKGRVIALFALLRMSDEAVWLVLPDADPHAIAVALQRFVFRSKVGILVRDDLKASGAFTPPAQARGNAIGGDVQAGIELDMGSEDSPRTLRLGTDAPPARPEAIARWQACDLEHGLPRLLASQVEHWTPQQLSLDRLRAFSVKKGCYPGQEIVARTHFLGQAKRGLALLEADAPMDPGMEVSAGAVALGKIVASGHDGARSVALAVLPLERDASSFLVGTVPARERALLDGLAR